MAQQIDLRLLEVPTLDRNILCVERLHRLAHTAVGSLCHQQQKILPHMKSRTNLLLEPNRG